MKTKYIRIIQKSSICLAVTASLVASTLSVAAMNADRSANSESESAFVVRNSQIIPTVSEWRDFLEAAAPTSDPYGFYDPSMESLITRSVTPDGFSYSVLSGQEDTLIDGVSDANLIGYDNWLQDGQLSNEKGIGTTEVENCILAAPSPFSSPGKPGPSEPVSGEPFGGGGW